MLVDEPTGWVASSARTPSDRRRDSRDGRATGSRLEITFRDCKEVVGAGQQQVRFMWGNIGAFHLCLWTFTMTEAWAGQ